MLRQGNRRRATACRFFAEVGRNIRETLRRQLSLLDAALGQAQCQGDDRDRPKEEYHRDYQ